MILTMTLPSVIVRSQTSGLSDYASVATPSSHIWQMTRFGTERPSLYTGTMETSVPIYTYSDPDFNIPVSLDYAFDGYRPSVHSGVVGMGWRLNCGGFITRKVVGLPDELDDNNIKGYLIFCGSNLSSIYNSSNGTIGFESTASHTNILDDAFYKIIFHDDAVFYDITNLGNNYYQYDTSSDIYQFSYPGGSGRFIVMSDGHIKVYDASSPFGEIDVTVTLVTGSGVECPEFVISTGDGYKYTYGGDNGHVEYNAPHELSNYSVCYSALTLKKITAPNGRQVDFIYSNSQQYELSYQEIHSGFNSFSLGESYSSGVGTPIKDVTTKVSRVLKSIRVDGRDIVKMNYEEKSVKEFSQDSFSNSLVWRISPSGERDYEPEARLSTIVILDKEGNMIDYLTLEHQYTSSNHGSPKMFLKSLTGNTGRYSFTNAHSSTSDSYPVIDSSAEDHWGYWRGTPDIYPISRLAQQDSSLYNLPNGIRGPRSQYSLYGALTSISYPTGGFCNIDYEPNDAGFLLDRTASFGVRLIDNGAVHFPVGGVRVKKIIWYDANGEMTDSNIFSYKTPDGKSSGVLMQMRRYCLYSLFSRSEFRGNRLGYPHLSDGAAGVYSTEDMSRFSMSPHVGYSYVREHHQDSSYTDYVFHDWIDSPDEYTHEGRVYSKTYMYYLNEGPEAVLVNGCLNSCNEDETNRAISLYSEPIIDRSGMRGKLKEVLEYNAVGTLTSMTKYRYAQVTNTTARRFTNLLSFFFETRTEHQYYYESEVEEATYDEGTPYSKRVQNNINHLGQTVSQQTVDFQTGLSNTVLTSYCHEFTSPAESGLSPLPSAVRSMVYLRGSVETDRNIFYYDQNSMNPSPCIITRTRGGVSRTTAIQYDSNFRPVRIENPGGRWRAFRWSSDGRHLLGSTENDESNNTSYTWQDLIGLGSVSLPSGQSESYTYDSKGRLSERCDTDGDTTVSYEYNLVNEE